MSDDSYLPCAGEAVSSPKERGNGLLRLRRLLIEPFPTASINFYRISMYLDQVLDIRSGNIIEEVLIVV